MYYKMGSTKSKPRPVDSVADLPVGQVIFMDYRDLVEHPFNPRGSFDFDSGGKGLTELEQSVKYTGIQEPVKVTFIGEHLRAHTICGVGGMPISPEDEIPDGEWVLLQTQKVVVLSGHRRTRASMKHRPTSEIKVIIEKITGARPIDKEMKALVAANAGHQAPSIVQKARTYRLWLAQREEAGNGNKKVTNAGIAETFGMSDSAARRMRIAAEFPAEVWMMFDAKKITEKAIDPVQAALKADVMPRTIAAELRRLAGEEKLSGGPIKEAMLALMPSKNKKKPDNAEDVSGINPDAIDDGSDPTVPKDGGTESDSKVIRVNGPIEEAVIGFSRTFKAKHGDVKHGDNGVQFKRYVVADVIRGVCAQVMSGSLTLEDAAGYFFSANLFIPNDGIEDLLDQVASGYKKKKLSPFRAKYKE